MPATAGETVDFTTDDGLRLCGNLPCVDGRSEQAGVIVYCHEYLSDRWSYHPYVDHLRDLGFDLFTFDFRNHGESESEPGYEPMQWTTDREVRDLRAALETLRSAARSRSRGFRPLRREPRGNDGAGRGVERARRLGRGHRRSVPDARNDGPLHQALVRDLRSQPDSAKSVASVDLHAGGAGPARRHTERRLQCRFPSVEAAAARLAPRPWLMIHGEADSYISPEIAQVLYDRGKEYKELWLVKDAKHNRCRETDPQGTPRGS